MELAANVPLKKYEVIRPNLSTPFRKPLRVRAVYGIYSFRRYDSDDRGHGRLVLIPPLSYSKLYVVRGDEHPIGMKWRRPPAAASHPTSSGAAFQWAHQPHSICQKNNS